MCRVTPKALQKSAPEKMAKRTDQQQKCGNMFFETPKPSICSSPFFDQSLRVACLFQNDFPKKKSDFHPVFSHVFHSVSPRSFRNCSDLFRYFFRRSIFSSPFSSPQEKQMVGGLEHVGSFSIYWECHHPNWGVETTNQIPYSIISHIFP